MAACVQGFGWRPIADLSARTGAGVRKSPVKEPAGSGRRRCHERYGDLAIRLNSAMPVFGVAAARSVGFGWAGGTALVSKAWVSGQSRLPLADQDIASRRSAMAA